MVRACVLVAALLVCFPAASAADDAKPQAVCVDCGPCCGQEKCRGGFSLNRLWGWATYRAGPVPRECRGWVPYAPAPMPPLYTFFLDGYGAPCLITGIAGCSSCSRGR